MKPKQTCVYMLNNDSKYINMFKTSVFMLRSHNQDIDINLVFLSSDDNQSLYDFCKDKKITIVKKKINKKNYIQSEKCRVLKHFFDYDQILFIDCDTFIFDNVDHIFNKYKDCEVAGCVNNWMFEINWNNNIIPNNYKPVNSGVYLINKLHRLIEGDYSNYLDYLTNNDNIILRWMKDNGRSYNAEELAFTFMIAYNKRKFRQFDTNDVKLLEYEDDIYTSNKTKIFHTYAGSWRRTRDVLFPCKNVFINTKIMPKRKREKCTLLPLSL